MTIHIERVGETRDRLGEGPLWDPDGGHLYWLDSMGCVIHRLDPDSGERRDWTVPDMIGSMALRDAGGAVIGLRTGLHFFDFETGAATLITDPEADDERTRLNDGKVDRRGRFLVGSMGITQREPPLGTLYRLDPDLGLTALESPVGVSNGPCFSPDGGTFYFSDSAAQTIYAYDYDQDTGAIANRRVFADLKAFDTAPDGGTVDASGNVWSAFVRSGEIGCFAPDGTLLRRIAMPCSLPSSVMFAGPDLAELYVTSISDSGSRKAEGPDDGGLFRLTGLGVHGLPEPRFRG